MLKTIPALKKIDAEKKPSITGFILLKPAFYTIQPIGGSGVCA